MKTVKTHMISYKKRGIAVCDISYSEGKILKIVDRNAKEDAELELEKVLQWYSEKELWQMIRDVEGPKKVVLPIGTPKPFARFIESDETPEFPLLKEAWDDDSTLPLPL
jgi:hypothetical protein